MTTSTTQPNIIPIDDSPLVAPRKPVAVAIDRDNDGKPESIGYDLNGDGANEIEHRFADRRTFVTISRVLPWEPAPSVTRYTGAPEDVPLRVTFKIKRIGELTFELNGVPVVACVASHGMMSLGLLWTADREHRDEVDAAAAFYLANGGVGAFERV